MRYLISLILLTTPIICTAYDYHLIDLNELSIQYDNYAALNDKARNALIYPDHPKEGINVNVNTTVARFGYVDSIIETLTNSGQYASIGLNIRLGLRVTDNLEFGIHHHSQHLLDRAHSYMDKFPSEDSVQLKLYLYREKNNGGMF